MTGRHRKDGTPARIVETSDYVAFMLRVIDRYGDRVAADPAALVHLTAIEQALRDSVNAGMFAANKGDAHYSQNEQARFLGLTRQAIAHRIKLGEAVVVRRQAATGALVRIGDVRAARADRMAAAGVEDRTGSVRELNARRAV